MIFAFEGKVCIPEKKRVQECVEKCTVMAVKSIFVSLLRPNEKMTMD